MESLVYSDTNNLIIAGKIIGHFNMEYEPCMLDSKTTLCKDHKSTNQANRPSFKIYKRAEQNDSFVYDQIFYILVNKLELNLLSVNLFVFDHCEDKDLLLLIVEFFRTFRLRNIEVSEDRTHISIKVENETVFFSAV